MKKIITILLTAALMLSLAACGGRNNSNTPTNSDNDTTTTTPEITAMTKEEMLETAIAIEDIKEFRDIISATATTSGYPYPKSTYRLGIYALHKLNEQNPVRFAQEYLNNIYKITGYVASINPEYFVLNIAPDGGANLDMNIYIYPTDKDDLLTITKNDLVTIVGELIMDEMIAKTGFSFYFNSAYIVGKADDSLGTQTITGTIFSIIKTPSYSDVVVALGIERIDQKYLVVVVAPTDNDKYIWYNIYLLEEYASGLKNGDEITVTGEVVPPPTTDVSGKIINYAPLDRKYSAAFYIVDPNATVQRGSSGNE